MCDDLKRRLGHFGSIIQLGSEFCVNLNLCWTTKSTVSLRLSSPSAQTHPYRQSWNGPLFPLFVPENSWVHGDGMRAPCTCLNPSAPCICLEPSKMPGLGCIDRSSKKASNLMVIETNLSVNLIRIFSVFEAEPT